MKLLFLVSLLGTLSCVTQSKSPQYSIGCEVIKTFKHADLHQVQCDFKNNSNDMLLFTLEESKNHINQSDFNNSKLVAALPLGMAFGISDHKGILVAGTMAAAISQVVTNSSNKFLEENLISEILIEPQKKRSTFILTKGENKTPPKNITLCLNKKCTPIEVKDPFAGRRRI